MAKQEEIPVIDLLGPDVRATTQQFVKALEEFGFAVVTNHGISEQGLKEAYRVTRDAFLLPRYIKRKYEHSEDGRHTGYCSFGIEKAVGADTEDLKEFWHYRVSVPEDRMRVPEEVPEFGPTMLSLFSALLRVSNSLLCKLDDYLGQPHGTFTAMTRGGDSLLRLLHYPALKGNEQGMRSAPHEDINLITLLVSATRAGLEARTRSGQWIPVNNPPNAIVVNSGDMLQLYTGGRIPSTTHRVVNGDGRARYSIPFFVHPRPEVVLSTHPYKTAGQYLQERLQDIGLKK